MPNCSAYPNQFSFQHNVHDDQYIILTPGDKQQVMYLEQHIAPCFRLKCMCLDVYVSVYTVVCVALHQV